MKKIKYNDDNIILELKEKEKAQIDHVLNTIKPITVKEEETHFVFNNKIKTIEEEKEKTIHLLKELLKEFPDFNKYPVLIVITGSFARGTNRFDSDLDLHFIYPNHLKKHLAIEEEIYLYLASVLSHIKRNRIHAVITTKLSKKNLKKCTKVQTKRELTVTLKYQDWSRSYTFYPTTKKRFYLNYRNSKSLRSFTHYLKKEIKNQNREWAHNFLAINKEEVWNQVYASLLHYEKRQITKQKLKKQIIYLEKRIENDSEQNVKKRYQTNMYYQIYNTLELVRCYLILNHEDIPYFNLIAFLKNEKFLKIVSKEEFRQIYAYLDQVEHLAYTLEQAGEIFSIHYDNDIKKYVNKELIKAYQEMQQELKNILNRLRRKINE